MRILLFGGSGQLGYEVALRAKDLSFEVVAPVTSEVNVGNEEQVRFLTREFKPQVVINCAAYTAVDNAETNRDLAFHINCDGARYVARAAKEINARVIHISTDYVFGGGEESLQQIPLTEESQVAPLNVYGESKLAGEQALLEEAGDSAVILRTASLFGQRGMNFVATMLKLFQEREELKIVSDQFMSPTWAGWLSEVVLDFCRMKGSGLFHATCKGGVSWFDFASTIEEMTRHLRPEKKVRLLPISAQEFARPAKRPPYSVFDCSKLEKFLGRPGMSWEEGVKGVLHDWGYL